MVTLRCRGGRKLNIIIKIAVTSLLFVFAVQLTYFQAYKAGEKRRDLTSTESQRETQRNDITAFRHNKENPKLQEKCDNSPPLRHFPDLYFKPPYQPRVYGKPRQGKGYLTIGIPSVQRPNTDKIYLYDTLDSIIEKTSKAEQQQITIVVLISDTNKTYNNKLSADIYSRYSTLCDSGAIHVLNTIDCIYPDLDNVKKTFNDSKPRLKWRAKQNIDFAFMMLYSKEISEFYIQLEDDVVVATDFIQDIRTFIHNTSQSWFLLEFSKLGFIGKLFRSSDLEFASMFLLKNYDRAPGDLLLGPMRVDRGQRKPLHSNISLFQHIGRFSSLRNKLMPSLDNTFKDAETLNLPLDMPSGDNPPARIKTSLSNYDNHIPEHAYDNDNSTYFWGKTPVKGDDFTLIFEMPHNFSRIIIPTGAVGTKKDSVPYAALMYSISDHLQASNDKYSCPNKFVKLVDMVDGDIDTMAQGTSIPTNIKCLRITATKKFKHWIIIRDIQLLLR